MHQHPFVVSILLSFGVVISLLINCSRLANAKWVTCSGIVQIRYRSDIISIEDFGGVGDGVTLNTKAFQEAIYRIQHLRRPGGSLLYVPAGEFLTVPFNLTSHMTLFLARNAVIKATTDTDQWPLINPLPSYGRGRERPRGRYMSFIHGDGLHDVIITTGENGTIDGQGEVWWNMWRQINLQFTRPNLNVIFKNSPFWNIHPPCIATMWSFNMLPSWLLRNLPTPMELIQDDRMSKVEMIKMKKSRKGTAQLSGVIPDVQGLVVSEKRKRPTSPEQLLLSHKKGSSPGSPIKDKGKGPAGDLGESPPISPFPLRSRRAPFTYGDSLMQANSGTAAWYLLQNLLPEVDLPMVQQATDQEVDEKMALGLLQGFFCAAERAARATRTREAFDSNKKALDDVWARHVVLTQQLQSFVDRMADEKALLVAESKAALERSELAEQRATIRAEHAEKEKDELALKIRILQQEAEAGWTGKKEEFIKSSEFNILCSEKALNFFEKGFKGCLDQVRANGYSETEHPLAFLDVDEALLAMPEEGEVSGTEAITGEDAEPKSN